MSSFFGTYEYALALSEGFDLFTTIPSDFNVEFICGEIENLYRENPDEQLLIIALDSLLTALNKHEEAIDLLNDDDTPRNPVLIIRLARHLLKTGDTVSAERELHSLLESGESKSIIYEICACLASGLLGNRDEFARRWNAILEDEELTDLKYDEDFFKNPLEYSLLGYLPILECIEGVKFLKEYEMKEWYEVEAYALICSFSNYLNAVSALLFDIMNYDQNNRAYIGFITAITISNAAILISENIQSSGRYLMAPEFLNAVSQKIIEINAKKMQFTVVKLLIENLNIYNRPTEGILSELRAITGGDDEYIIDLIKYFDEDEILEDGFTLIADLMGDNPDNLILKEKYYNFLMGKNQYNDALKFAKTSPELRISSDELLETELLSLIADEKKEETFSFLLSRIIEGKLTSYIDILFELAIEMGRFSELIAMLLEFEKNDLRIGIYIIKGYERLQQKDIKGALSYFERSISAGMPEETALTMAARFMIPAGYAKRAVGICEKLLKKSSVNPEKVYPVLIEAYKARGMTKEAKNAETILFDLIKNRELAE